MIRNRKAAITLNVMIALFFVFDLIEDLLHDDLGFIFVVELMIFGMVVTLLFYEMNMLHAFKTKYLVEREKSERLSGALRDYIEAQFSEWTLTESEAEIAWMLIHGYAFVEIAESRNTKEKTVRQQATAIYAKSATKNRAEFVALFLEGLLSQAHH